MNGTAQNANAYLRTKVMTASPAQLRLMLFDGAIKFCRQARDAVVQRRFENLYNALTRAQKIVLELSTSLNPDIDPELCDRLASLYNYIYLRLVDANIERDETAIDECIRLLEYERETWAMLMKKLEDGEGATANGEGANAVAPPATAPGVSGPDAGPADDARPNPIGNIGPSGARMYGATGTGDRGGISSPGQNGFSVQG